MIRRMKTKNSNTKTELLKVPGLVTNLYTQKMKKGKITRTEIVLNSFPENTL